MRVLFITVGDTSRYTGGYAYNRRIINGLRNGGMEVEEVVASEASVGAQRHAALGFTPGVERFDVVVVDALAAPVCAPHLGRWRSLRPVVGLVHELPSVALGEEGLAAFEGPLLEADLLITVSEDGKRVLERYGADSGHIRVLPPGLELPRRIPAETPPSGVRALCVAQWIPRKEILTLVRAWKGMSKAGATLTLVGETKADREYGLLVRREIGEDDSIEEAGTVDGDDLAGLYASSSLFVLASRYEGYGMVYAEAMSYGLPVVGARVGPVPAVVGEAALLVEPGDVGGLRRAMDRLLTNPALRRQLSEAALERAASLPGWGETVEGFARVLREVRR